MRVCVLGTFESNYDRNRIVIDSLREQGIEVHIIHEPLWENIRHKTLKFYNPIQLAKILFFGAKAALRLSSRYLRAPAHDCVWVGYLGHFDLPLVYLLTQIRRKPIVFDAFVSLYDTLVEDRAVVKSGSLFAKLLKIIDRSSCRLATRVVLDTDQHIDYFVHEFQLPQKKFRRLLVGADTHVFRPVKAEKRFFSEGGLKVLHYSKFAPLHGIPVILEAAKNLKEHPEIQFLMVGGGQLREACDELKNQFGLRHLAQLDWLDEKDLNLALAECDVVLGIFGTTRKAQRVIPNKVYQALATQKALITMESPAMDECFKRDEHYVGIPPGDPRALTQAILDLNRDATRRNEIANRGYLRFQEVASEQALGRELASVVDFR